MIRDVPRGQVSFGGGALTDQKDNELLSAYPFGGGDLHGPGAANSMSTPLAIVQTSADDYVLISPLDNKVRPKRFYFQPGEKFYRVARDGQEKDEESTGLGLAFVKEVVEQHGGSVEVESEVGRGSKFGFALPRL